MRCGLGDRWSYLEEFGAETLRSFEQVTGGLSFITVLHEAAQRDDRIRLHIEEFLECGAQPASAESGFLPLSLAAPVTVRRMVFQLIVW